jgi:hypothetical protein
MARKPDHVISASSQSAEALAVQWAANGLCRLDFCLHLLQSSSNVCIQRLKRCMLKTASAQPTFQRHVAEMARAMAEEHGFLRLRRKCSGTRPLRKACTTMLLASLAELEVGQ